MGDKNSVRAIVLSGVVAGAFATLIAGVVGWLIDAEITAFFLVFYGLFMAISFVAMGLWRRRKAAR